jgi:hypothetical protein
MKLYNLYESVIFEEVEKSKGLLTEGVSDDKVIDAINGMYNVNITYRDKETGVVSAPRYIQVYVYGQLLSGNYAIRAYQISGPSLTDRSPKYKEKMIAEQNTHWKIFLLESIVSWQPTKMKWYSAQDQYNPNGDSRYNLAVRGVEQTFKSMPKPIIVDENKLKNLQQANIEEPKINEPTIQEPKIQEPKINQPRINEPRIKKQEPVVQKPKVIKQEPKINEPKIQEPNNLDIKKPKI